jgi:ddrB-like ParB superfamily domain
MSMIDEDANTETVNQTAKVPDLPKPAPSKERSAWNLVTTVPRAAVGELAAGAIDVGVGLYRGMRESARVKTKEERDYEARHGSGFDGQNEASRSIRNVVEDIKPDPVTSHAAEQFVFEAGRVVVKAVGLGLTTGPAAIPLLAASEGIETSDALQQKGVAKATADQAGVVSALTTGIGAVIPVAPMLKGFTGNNVAKVFGLAGVSGPATFMAQQKLTSDILAKANYTELAKQYDPLDLQGLVLSMAPGLAFGGLALRGGAKPSVAVTPSKPGVKPEVQPEDQVNINQAATNNVAPAVSQDAIDAAMTHNLTLLRDAQVLRGNDLQQNQAVAQQTIAQAATNNVAKYDYQDAYKKRGGLGDVDDSLDIGLKSETFKEMAAQEGWTVGYSDARGKYFRLEKDLGKDADGYDQKITANIRVSDHSKTNNAAHFGEHDINIAPDDGYARDTFDSAIGKLRNARLDKDGNTVFDAPDKTATIITERGMQVQTRYKLVEADALVTSHGNDLNANPAFPAELQPRDRARAASADQIARIENQIRPELLGESVKASDGAPIVGPDAVVENGNARTIALRRAYDSGKADEYRAWLSGNAERFGATAEAVAGMKRPVLVRERTGDIDRAEFTRQANESPVAALSPTEQARADAARTKDLSGLVPNEDGSVNMAQSAAWVRSFMQGVPPTERGAMMQADGQLSQAGAQRIRNAVFAKAYGDPAILSALSESTNSNIKNILAGLLRAAPDVAKLQDLIASGARQPMDFAPDLVRAVRELSDLRAKGVSVEQHLTQGSMFDGGLPAELNNLLVGLSENARSPKRIAEMVKSMVQAVDNLGDPRQASLLSDAPPTRGDMTANAVERMRTLTDEQLTDTAPETFKPSTDPLMRSIADRVAVAEASHGDLQVGTTADGQPITIAQALEQVRREALDGTPDELGHNEAHLVQAAADCFLSTGV